MQKIIRVNDQVVLPDNSTIDHHIATFEEIPLTLDSEDGILKYMSRIASVVFNRDNVKSVRGRFIKLLTEAYGNRPSSVMRFIPIVIRDNEDPELTTLLKNSKKPYWHIGKGIEGAYDTYHPKDYTIYYTNIVECINLGIVENDYDEVIEFIKNHTDKYIPFKTVRITAPYFIFGQLSRAQTMAIISHSQRYAISDKGYYFPKEFIEYCYNNDSLANIKLDWNIKVRTTSPDDLQSFMKNELGIKRKEINDRGVDMLQNRSFCLGGWINDLYSGWGFLINQRTDNHTQYQTKRLVQEINKELKIV